jgi:conjugative transfer signal peptidase TraF
MTAAGLLLEHQHRLFGRRRALTGREKRRVIAGIVGAAVAVVGFVVGCHSAGLWINTTDSLPVGLWREVPGQAAEPGDVVLLCLPATPAIELGQSRGYIAPGACSTGQEILLKPIAAGAGDMVVVSSDGITVNGRELANSAQLVRDRPRRRRMTVRSSARKARRPQRSQPPPLGPQRRQPPALTRIWLQRASGRANCAKVRRGRRSPPLTNSASRKR